MFRSIRWSLQLWHAGILGVALASFGTALYIGISRAQFSRVNAELEGAARVFVNATMTPGALGPDFSRGPRGGGGGGGRGFGGRGGGGQGGGRGGGNFGGPDGPPPDNGGGGPDGFGRGGSLGGFGGGGRGNGFGPGGGGPGPGGASGGPWVGSPEWWASVPEDALRRIGENEQDQPYFVVFGYDGTILRSSENAADIGIPVPSPTPPSLWNNYTAAQPEFRTRGTLQEVILQGPLGLHVLVGKSLDSVHSSLLYLRWELLGAGAAVMAIGLCGGWLLSLRATRPIRAISQTARAISASDLSRRITVGQTDSELDSLALTLNDTFDRLQVAFDRQIRFTADASHELRTPLSVIHSQAELSLSRDRTAPEYKQSLETCLRAAKRMKSLVESLLVLARADAGKLVLNVERFDLAAAAEECAAMVAPRAAERRVTVELQVQPVEINADRTKIMQLITNLLANAIQYNQDGGKVTLSIAPGMEGAGEGGEGTAKDVLIRVADTGVGISPEEQAQVFERFFRADKARSRDLGGSGLGLAICRSIAEAHHGTITFTSQLGQGTTFNVRLPTDLRAACGALQ